MTSSDSMIPGALAPRVMACETCGEEATFVEQSLVPACDCMDPPGIHIVRRCSAGHDNLSHVFGAEEEFETASEDETYVRFPADKETIDKIDHLAKHAGANREDFILGLLEDHIIKCLRCRHGKKKHASDVGPCEVPGCPCEELVISVDKSMQLSEREIVLGEAAIRIAKKVRRLVPSATTEIITQEILGQTVDRLVCQTCIHPFSGHDGTRCYAEGCACHEVCPPELRDEAIAKADPHKIARAIKSRILIAAVIAREPRLKSVYEPLLSASDEMREKFIEAIRAIDSMPMWRNLTEAKEETGKRSPLEKVLWSESYHKGVELFRQMLIIEKIERSNFDQILESKSMAAFLLEENMKFSNELDFATGSFGSIAMMRLAWAKQREFRLSPAIAESLLLTEVRGVSATDIKLPYDTFLVRFPPGLIDLVGSDGETYPMISAVVCEWKSTRSFWESERTVSIFGLCTWNKTSLRVIDTTCLAWLISLDDTDLRTMCISGDEQAANETNKTAITLATRLIVNTCLYVSLPAADVVLEGQEALNRLREQTRKHPAGSKKGERARAALADHEGKPQIRHVGWSIKVPSSIREAAARERTKKGRAFTAQWVVRGHWRNQPVGDRLLGQHKRIWIMPYFCRRDLGERLTQPPYRVS